MKTLLRLFLLLLPIMAEAQVIPTQPIRDLVNWSSYNTQPYVRGVRYYASHYISMYPQWTNEIHDFSFSGSGFQGDVELHYEANTLPYLATWAPYKSRIIINVNDNGGYHSNEVVLHGLKFMQGPPSYWNGTTIANQGVSISQTVEYWFYGGIPGDSTGGDTGGFPSSREQGALYLNSVAGTFSLPLFTLVNYTYHWSNDITAGRIMGFEGGPSGHPLPPGHLAMAFGHLLLQRVETNVASVTLNYTNTSGTLTNHCAVVSVTTNGTTNITGTIRYTRMPMGWDIPGTWFSETITNNAHRFFELNPGMANAFNWPFIAKNLSSGTWELLMDNRHIVTASSIAWSSGVNLFTNMNGWLGDQRRAVQNSYMDEYGVDHVTGLNKHDAGSFGVHGVWDDINFKSHANAESGNHGATVVANMASSVGAMRTNSYYTYLTAQQTNHTFSLVQISFEITSEDDPAPLVY